MFQQTIDARGDTQTSGTAFFFNKHNWERVFIRLHFTLLQLWNVNSTPQSKPYDTICIDQAMVTRTRENMSREFHIKVKLNQLKNSVLTFGFFNEREANAWFQALISASGIDLAPNYIHSNNTERLARAEQIRGREYYSVHTSPFSRPRTQHQPPGYYAPMYDPYAFESSSRGSQNIASSSDFQIVSSINPLESYKDGRSLSPMALHPSRPPSLRRKKSKKKSKSPHTPRQVLTPPPPPPPSKSLRKATPTRYQTPGIFQSHEEEPKPSQYFASSEKESSELLQSSSLIESRDCSLKIDLLQEIKEDREKKELRELEQQKLKLEGQIQGLIQEVKKDGIILPNSLVFWKFMKEKKIQSKLLGDLAIAESFSYFQDSCWVEIIGLAASLFFKEQLPKIKHPGLTALSTFNSVLRYNSYFWTDFLPAKRGAYFSSLAKFELFLKSRNQGMNFFLELRERLSSTAIRLSVQFNLGIRLQNIEYDCKSETPVQMKNLRTIEVGFLATLATIKEDQSIQTPRSHQTEEFQPPTFGKDESVSQILSCVSYVHKKQTQNERKEVASILDYQRAVCCQFNQELQREELRFKDHRHLYLITSAQKLLKQGKLEEAEHCCELYLEEEYGDALDSMIYQIKMLIAFNQQKVEEIEENYKNAADSINEHYSSAHPLHIQLNLLMAHIFYHLDPNQGLTYSNQALKLSLSIYGQQHKITLQCKEVVLKTELVKGVFLETAKFLTFLKEHPKEIRKVKNQEFANQFPKWRHIFKQCESELAESTKTLPLL